jgi:hypothetical protein
MQTGLGAKPLIAGATLSDPMSSARIRAQSVWYRDGLSDILIGVITLLQNGLTLVMHFGNRYSSWYMPVVLIYLLLFFAFALCARRIMAAARERITYPRVGYSQPGDSQRKLNRVIVALTILAIFGFTLAVLYGRWDTSRGVAGVPVVGGLLFCAIGTYVGVRYGVLRYLLIGLCAIVVGLAIEIECPTWLGAEIWLVFVGCAFLCSGGVTVWNFVRTTTLSVDAK